MIILYIILLLNLCRCGADDITSLGSQLDLSLDDSTDDHATDKSKKPRSQDKKTPCTNDPENTANEKKIFTPRVWKHYIGGGMHFDYISAHFYQQPESEYKYTAVIGGIDGISLDEYLREKFMSLLGQTSNTSDVHQAQDCISNNTLRRRGHLGYFAHNLSNKNFAGMGMEVILSNSASKMQDTKDLKEKLLSWQVKPGLHVFFSPLMVFFNLFKCLKIFGGFGILFAPQIYSDMTVEVEDSKTQPYNFIIRPAVSGLISCGFLINVYNIFCIKIMLADSCTYKTHGGWSLQNNEEFSFLKLFRELVLNILPPLLARLIPLSDNKNEHTDYRQQYFHISIYFNTKHFF